MDVIPTGGKEDRWAGLHRVTMLQGAEEYQVISGERCMRGMDRLVPKISPLFPVLFLPALPSNSRLLPVDMTKYFVLYLKESTETSDLRPQTPGWEPLSYEALLIHPVLEISPQGP